MSIQRPGMCRSMDCEEWAAYHLMLFASDSRNEKWTGEFCHIHALRVLDIKMTELDTRHYAIVIEPLFLIGSEWQARRMRSVKRALGKVVRGTT